MSHDMRYHSAKAHAHITKERLKVYERAFELKNQGLGPRRISRLIHVPMNTVGGWFYKGSHPLGSTHQLEIEPSSELSYVIGVSLGDGSTYYNKKSQCYRICLTVKAKEFADSFSKAISRIVGRTTPYKVMPCKRNLYHVEIGCYVLFTFLRQPLEKLKLYIKAFPKDFLRGFYESEGNLAIHKYYWDIKKRKRIRKTFQLRLNMSNLRRELLLIAKEALEDLGLHPTLVGPYKACKLYQVFLSRNNEVRRFMNLVMPCIKRGGI